LTFFPTLWFREITGKQKTKETIVLTVRTTFCNFFANITCFLSNFRFEPQVTYLEVPTVATRDVVTPH